MKSFGLKKKKKGVCPFLWYPSIHPARDPAMAVQKAVMDNLSVMGYIWERRNANDRATNWLL